MFGEGDAMRPTRSHKHVGEGKMLAPARAMDRMDRWFDDLLTPRLGLGWETDKWGWSFAVDVEESKDAFVLKAELPGLHKDNVKIDCEDGILTISGEKRMEKTTEDKRMHRVERAYGSFQRSFTLPPGAKADEVKAIYKDGLLTVTVPKHKGAKPHEVQIKVDG
jgi:HSP20 family protein